MTKSVPITSTLAQAVRCQQSGRLPEAERLYRAILRTSPNHPEANHNLGLLSVAAGRPGQALPHLRAALEAQPSDVRFWLSYIDALIRSGQSGLALRAVAEGRRHGLSDPGFQALLAWADATARGGAAYAGAVALHTAGRLEEAVAEYRRTLDLHPDLEDALANLGMALYGLGRLEQAEGCYRRLLEMRPGNAMAANNLGNILRQSGRLDEAETVCRQAVEIMPNLAAGHYNLGLVLAGLGRLPEAVDSHRRAVEAAPDFAEAHCALADSLYRLGRLEAAVETWRRVLDLKPDLAEAHLNLGITLLELGRAAEALRCCLSAMAADETPASRMLFVNCVRSLRPTRDDGRVRALLVRALSEPWGMPADLMPLATAMIRLAPEIEDCIAGARNAHPRRPPLSELFPPSGIAAASGDALLHAALTSAPIQDLDFERFLISARHALLHAVGGTAPERKYADTLLAFHCALAQQCFITEYIHDCAGEELEAATALRARLVAALDNDAAIPARWLPAVASYFPLHTLPDARRLLDRTWPEEARAMLASQVEEPLAEAEYRSAIPRLTPIDDDVSRQVAALYEANPYPRWVRVSVIDEPRPLDEVLRRTFPLARFHPLDRGDGIDVLVAGCGTGQHPICTAQTYRAARLLAIDLSMASLCYAKRKTAELGLDAIEYAQADITRLSGLGRRFDVIEAVGVLHHLADPLEGWRTLLGLLRPRGVMRIGLYSELARRDVARARDFIAAGGYGSSPEEIRRCRRDLIEAGDGADFASLAGFSDFFGTSPCRDLLFHVQEHRLTLETIARFCDENGLRFLGFTVERPVLDAYRRRFPHDPAATDLRQWQALEMENPDTFRSMYQFWIQRIDI
ncbi:tetratricopeptide repeat protein [Magnetospirillum sp. 15-1]|uniref:tetratricopeptide repeat protein n=1 Tax=Magnetospirillum sp. 15-1 TaxID=1979370 RepID=UPI000BBCDDCC|nr:tetratricopeptide repeat protein [Magnetospirillum sp. 15-1]